MFCQSGCWPLPQTLAQAMVHLFYIEGIGYDYSRLVRICIVSLKPVSFQLQTRTVEGKRAFHPNRLEELSKDRSRHLHRKIVPAAIYSDNVSLCQVRPAWKRPSSAVLLEQCPTPDGLE